MAAAACLLAFKLEDSTRSVKYVADAVIKAAIALTGTKCFSTELLNFVKAATGGTRGAPVKPVSCPLSLLLDSLCSLRFFALLLSQGG